MEGDCGKNGGSISRQISVPSLLHSLTKAAAEVRKEGEQVSPFDMDMLASLIL